MILEITDLLFETIHIIDFKYNYRNPVRFEVYIGYSNYFGKEIDLRAKETSFYKRKLI